MPLLSLPCELLLDIVEKVNAGCYKNPDTVQLAQTCQLLRSLSVAFVYSSVAVRDEKHSLMLHGLLTSYPQIADCVRFLKLFPLGIPPHSKEPQLRDILSRCKKLRELCLESLVGRGKFTNLKEVLLEQLAPESKGSIETIKFLRIGLDTTIANFTYLLDSGEFGRLETVKVVEPYELPEGIMARIGGYIRNACTTLASSKLESVRTFHLEGPPGFTPVAPDIGPLDIGGYFARVMPNVEVLSMTAELDYIHGTLFAYAGLGSQLTRLTLHCTEPSESRELCETLSKLSPKLTGLMLSGPGLGICHKMFTVSAWTQLALLKINCCSGCQGIELDLFRTHLKKLTETRPMATITVNRCYSELVSWNCEAQADTGERRTDHYIAPLEIFKKLDPAYVDSDDELYYDEEDEEEEYEEYGYEEDEDDFGYDYGEGVEMDSEANDIRFTEEFACHTGGPSDEDMLAFFGIGSDGCNCEEAESGDEEHMCW